MLPVAVFQLIGRMTPPEIRPDKNSNLHQNGYTFEFANGKLQSWTKPKPFVFKVKK